MKSVDTNDQGSKLNRATWTLVLPLALIIGVGASAAQRGQDASKPAASSASQSVMSTATQPDKRVPRYYGFYEPEPYDFIPATPRSSTARRSKIGMATPPFGT